MQIEEIISIVDICNKTRCDGLPQELISLCLSFLTIKEIDRMRLLSKNYNTRMVYNYILRNSYTKNMHVQKFSETQRNLSISSCFNGPDIGFLTEQMVFSQKQNNLILSSSSINQKDLLQNKRNSEGNVSRSQLGHKIHSNR